MKLNRFSMFAIGAAVLTLSACTEADQFDTYTKDGKKYITTINVSNVTPELGTRTYFDTSNGNYGKVYWENGTNHDNENSISDELYFYEVGTPTPASVFACSNDGNWHDGYDFAAFSVKGHSNGLEVGHKYYAYYFPGYLQYLPNGQSMPLNDWHWEGDEDVHLRSFLRTYDFLKLEDRDGQDGGVLPIEGVQNTIYMNHFFSLIVIDLKQDNFFPNPSGTEIPPCFSKVTILSKTEPNAFGTDLKVDDHGFMKTVTTTSTISLLRTEQNISDLTLSEDNTLLRYFFVIENKNAMQEFSIQLGDGKNYKAVKFDGKDQSIKFEQGQYYHFILEADFRGMTEYTDGQWIERGNIIVVNRDALQSAGIFWNSEP